MKYYAKLFILPLAAMMLTACGGTTPTVEEAKLQSITLSGDYKTDFFVNDTFTYEGLVVTASYSDNSTKVVAPTNVESPNMSIAGNYTVNVTYTEKDVTAKNSYTVSVKERTSPEQDKVEAIAAIQEAFDKLDIEDYTDKRWNLLLEKLRTSIAAVNAATDMSTLDAIVSDAVNYFETMLKNSDITKGTWFDAKSSESRYELDRDDDNNLTISYDDYPGHWVWVGTSSLETDLTTGNVVVLKFRNDGEYDIKVCLQLIKGDYKADTGIIDVSVGEIKTISLPFEQNVNNLLFFVDSCSEHNHAGKVTILEAKMEYEEARLYEPKTISMNKDMVKGDDGVNTHYTVLDADKGAYIYRVDAMVQVDFHGNGNSMQYFGIELYAGANGTIARDNGGHSQTTAIDGVANAGVNFYMNLPIEEAKKLSTGSDIFAKINYAAEGLTFKLLSYHFFYTLWNQTVEETVEVNKVIYNGVDSDGNTNPKENATIPYSSFNNTGRVDHFVVSFTTINTAGYAKTQIHFSGSPFTQFSSGNNNVLNISPIMENNSPDEKTGSMVIYPTSTINLSNEGTIEIECWWASASMIKVNSITMVTDSMAAPEPVTGLEAHPIDSGVVLTWSASDFAREYYVYVGGERVSTVKSTFARIDDLTNGQEYTFTIVAANTSGESEGVSINASPVAGGTYDTFIEGLNTALEEKIGQERMDTLFAESSCYSQYANNYRLKRVINKLKNGEDTTVLFMGGSITVGEGASEKQHDNHDYAKGFAYYTYQWLKNNYDTQNKLRYINAAISGTGSEIGIVRSQKDVLDYNPDLVFIEYAANNGTTDFYNQSYESLIRRCQNLPSDPAIVLVFSVTYYSGSAEGIQSQIGAYYGLPMFSMHRGLSAIVTKLDQDRTDPIFHDYTDDSTHPNDNGHKLMAKALCYFLRNLISQDTHDIMPYPTSPQYTNGDKYEGFVSIDNKSTNTHITSLGSFYATNTATTSTSKQSDVTAFQQGWKKTDTTTNEPMVIDVNAKNFILIYEAGNKDKEGDPIGNIVVTYTNKHDASDTGTLTWDVQLTVRQSISGSTEIVTKNAGHGWQNPVGILIFDKTVADDYTITIQMDDVTGICTIMAFGYTA